MNCENSRHHRKLKSHGGSDFPPNTIRVPHKAHEAYHILFTDKTPQQIVADLNDIWLPLEYKVILVPRDKHDMPNELNVTERAY